MLVTTCDSCAAGIANADWTHIDAQDDADETMAAIGATLELLGYLASVGPADEPGYFTCYVCDEIQCGGGHVFESEKDV